MRRSMPDSELRSRSQTRVGARPEHVGRREVPSGIDNADLAGRERVHTQCGGVCRIQSCARDLRLASVLAQNTLAVGKSQVVLTTPTWPVVSEFTPNAAEYAGFRVALAISDSRRCSPRTRWPSGSPKWY